MLDIGIYGRIRPVETEGLRRAIFKMLDGKITLDGVVVTHSNKHITDSAGNQCPYLRIETLRGFPAEEFNTIVSVLATLKMPIRVLFIDKFIPAKE